MAEEAPIDDLFLILLLHLGKRPGASLPAVAKNFTGPCHCASVPSPAVQDAGREGATSEQIDRTDPNVRRWKGPALDNVEDTAALFGAMAMELPRSATLRVGIHGAKGFCFVRVEPSEIIGAVARKRFPEVGPVHMASVSVVEDTPEPTPEAVEEFLLTQKAKQAPHDAARDWASLSGRWGQQHSALPDGLAGIGARGQGPVAPAPDRFGVTTRRLTGDTWEPIHNSAARTGDRVRYFGPSGALLAEFVLTSDAHLQADGLLAGEWVHDGVFVPQEHSECFGVVGPTHIIPGTYRIPEPPPTTIKQPSFFVGDQPVYVGIVTTSGPLASAPTLA